jgi:hypothetical protein
VFWHLLTSQCSHQLELRNEDGTLMAYICGTMPQSLRTSLLQRLLLAFEDENMLIDKDTKQDADNSFQAVHFSWYNRHATRVSRDSDLCH